MIVLSVVLPIQASREQHLRCRKSFQFHGRIPCRPNRKHASPSPRIATPVRNLRLLAKSTTHLRLIRLLYQVCILYLLHRNTGVCHDLEQKVHWDLSWCVKHNSSLCTAQTTRAQHNDVHTLLHTMHALHENARTMVSLRVYSLWRCPGCLH